MQHRELTSAEFNVREESHFPYSSLIPRAIYIRGSLGLPACRYKGINYYLDKCEREVLYIYKSRGYSTLGGEETNTYIWASYLIFHVRLSL